VAREDSDAFACNERPHANRLIGLIAGRENICAIGVPCDLVDIVIVADHEAEIRDVVLGPDSDGLVPAAADKVVTEGAPTNIPDGPFMAFVDYEASPCLEGPESDCLIGRAGKEELRSCGRGIGIGIIGSGDGGREGGGVYRGRMANETT